MPLNNQNFYFSSIFLENGSQLPKVHDMQYCFESNYYVRVSECICECD